MKVLVTGGAGQLARAVAATWRGHECLLLGREALDLEDPSAIARALHQHRPDIVLNAGAHTQVDRCEAEPERALRLNAEPVRHLAEGCAALGSLLIQISTDYVFDGQATRPYVETDPTFPGTVYGQTKLEGERLATLAPNHLIVRTSWLYEAWGKNFLQTMLRVGAQGKALKVVADQQGTPTSCRALARQLEVAVQERWRGLVHVSCHGETTWHGFAEEIFRQRAMTVALAPCTTADYPVPAKRPAYSVLAAAHRRALGTDVMPDWTTALAEVLAEGVEE